jgi:hypothetical protein
MMFTAKRLVSDSDAGAVFQLTNGSGITVTDAVGGLFDIEIIPTNTYSMTSGATLVCDVQLKDATTRVFTIGLGTLVVNEDVTRTYT